MVAASHYPYDINRSGVSYFEKGMTATGRNYSERLLAKFINDIMKRVCQWTVIYRKFGAL